MKVANNRFFWISLAILAATTATGYYFFLTLDPSSAATWQFGAAYSLIFIWVCAAVTLFFPFRQGVLFATLICFALWLLASGLFSLLTAALTLLIFALLEVYAISN